MAQSPPGQAGHPFSSQTVADLLDTPTLARTYAHILHHGPVTVSAIVDELDVPQGTAYDYVEKLSTRLAS